MATRLVITLHDDGRLQLEAPVDKIAAVGLLELAKHALLSQRAEAPRIAPASVIPSLGINGRAVAP
jgi:hypothetical protein